MKKFNILITIVTTLMPLWLSASAFKPTFVADKPKVCLEKNAMSELVTFTNTTEEALWTGKITYNWKFINTTTKDSTSKTGYGPFSILLAEGDWVVVLDAIDEKTPEPNRGFSKQQIYVGRKKAIIMPKQIIACVGSFAELTANEGFEQYIWLKNKDTIGKTQNILVAGEGIYKLTAVSYANCMSEDSVKVLREICSATDDMQATNRLKISPNPATDKINATAAFNSSVNLSISITDVMGREVLNENMGNASQFEKEIDVSAFAKGIYHLRYLLDGHIAKTERLIIK